MRSRGASSLRICSLWPGHEDELPNGAWQPDNYPLPAVSASAFLSALEALSHHDLEVLRHSLSTRNFSNAIEESAENAAMAEFAGRRKLRDSWQLARELAQRLLLWSWHHEKALGELDELESKCLAAEQALRKNFLEPGDVDLNHADRPDPGSSFNWRPVVANAAFFIPPGVAIFAEGEMAAEIEERLNFEDANPGLYGFEREDGVLLQAIAPLWAALGHSRQAADRAAAIYNPSRVWLIWREN